MLWMSVYVFYYRDMNSIVVATESLLPTDEKYGGHIVVARYPSVNRRNTSLKSGSVSSKSSIRTSCRLSVSSIDERADG